MLQILLVAPLDHGMRVFGNQLLRYDHYFDVCRRLPFFGVSLDLQILFRCYWLRTLDQVISVAVDSFGARDSPTF